MKCKKKSKKLFKITLIIIILLFLFIVYQLYNIFFNEIFDNKIKIVEVIEGYDYELKENSGPLYKKYFMDLKKLLEEDYNDEEYARLVSSMFIIDFFSLQNKTSKNDVGGCEFVYNEIRDNFIDKARATYYKYININKVDQNLPIVKKIDNINIKKINYIFDGISDKNAFLVNISWSYEKENGYQKNASLILIHNNKKLFIVEMNKK